MIKKDYLDNIKKLEKKIKYRFKNRNLPLLAITHSSFANENKAMGVCSNERLEFLGDAVLNIVVSEHIYLKYPELPEGELTKIRAAVVCEPTISNCAKELELGEHILLGKGEEMTGGRRRTSILSDVFEAVAGAVYLDGGLRQAKRFLLRVLGKYIDDVEGRSVFVDYKTKLQEMVQRVGKAGMVYEVTGESGPEHDKIFEVQVRAGSKVMGKGKGRSKKEAEQVAASDAIRTMENEKKKDSLE